MMLVKCTETFSYGRGSWVAEGGLYDSDADIVRRYPSMFSAVEVDSWGRLAVESASAAPGERRMLSRARDRAVAEPEFEPTVEPEPEPVVEVERGSRPWVTATKDDWAAYAVTLGVDVEGMTKMGIMDAVEAAEAGAGGR